MLNILPLSLSLYLSLCIYMCICMFIWKLSHFWVPIHQLRNAEVTGALIQGKQSNHKYKHHLEYCNKCATALS